MTLPLKTDPKYGFFPWWPEEGEEWIHPDDVQLARQWIPGNRVLRRDGEQGPYILLHYGDQRLRVLRTLWKELAGEGFDVGDMVEIRTRGMQNEHRTGSIREMLWDDNAETIHYQIDEAGIPVETLYTVDDLKHVDPTHESDDVRIEPSGEDADELLP